MMVRERQEQRRIWQWSLSALLVLATVVFVIGAIIEHSSEGTPAHNEAAELRTAGETAHTETAAHTETTGGLHLESTGTVVAAVVVSLAVAAVLALNGSTAVLVLVALFSLVFVGLDAREVGHQVDLSKTGVAIIAALAAVCHFAVTVGALGLVWPRLYPRRMA